MSEENISKINSTNGTYLIRSVSKPVPGLSLAQCCESRLQALEDRVEETQARKQVFTMQD